MLLLGKRNLEAYPNHHTQAVGTESPVAIS